MESDNTRIHALDLLKLSSIAYIESQNYGECKPDAACQNILRKYKSVMVSRKPSTSVPSSFTPKSGLNLESISTQEFIKDIMNAHELKCGQSNNITDEDVKALILSSESKSSDGNYEISSERSQIFSRGPENSNLVESRYEPLPKRSLKEFNDFKLKSNESYEPPRKIFAPASSSPSVPVSSNQRQEKSLFQQLEQQFMNGRDSKAPTNVTETIPNNSASTNSISNPATPTSNYKPGLSTPSAAKNEADFSKQRNPSQSTNLWPDITSASKELRVQNLKKYGNSNPIGQRHGLSKSDASSFKPPLLTNEPVKESKQNENPLLKGIDEKLLEIIENEVVVNAKEITWDDIAGLEAAKDIIQEAVILPLLRPDLFQGLRSIPKGILLFGPPGTGKTLIGKCIAAQSDAKFLSISASTLTSKWIGEGEKLVRALFAYARVHQPSVIFLDEIDSILKKRSDTEHESSRRLKTEFLIQFEGTNTIQDNDRVLLVGATNLPQELDDAARRRFTKRLYIPLPEKEGRRELLARLLQKNANSLTGRDLIEIAAATDGYSGADIKTLCADASMSCLRELSKSQIQNVDVNSLRPINVEDFRKSLKRVKATVSQSELQQYIDWNSSFGSTS